MAKFFQYVVTEWKKVATHDVPKDLTYHQLRDMVEQMRGIGINYYRIEKMEVRPDIGRQGMIIYHKKGDKCG